MALSDIRTLVEERVRETAGLITPPQMERAIQAAVKAYSRVRERVRVQTITGNGVAVTFALATDFEEGLSRILDIEQPVDKQIPEYLDASDYRLYRDPTTGVLKLRFLTMTLGNTIKAYVTYTVRHTV